MTPSELKYKVEEAGHDSQFFTHHAMRFFGDRMSNYGVRPATINTYTRKKVKAWELFRRRPVKCGLKSSSYFDAMTYKRLFNADEGQ